ncbi:hypothetical protein IWQ60_008319 [Tieghemiomyces parasiticus]|uniref:Uncharacterized protein n=1 Tax=Tieghemiomyces parasiticus TaxID=78921 RepID=A0A9W8DNA7_9FUNG|nr:hypothetical protein IWQ60_008319 [Tieghemiomyces parasiticus]
MASPAHYTGRQRKARHHLLQLRDFQTQWDELCYDGLTLATAVVNSRIEATYADLPTHWPPALLVFPNLRDKYRTAVLRRVYQHAQALDHILNGLASLLHGLQRSLTALEDLVNTNRSAPPCTGSDADTALPWFCVATPADLYARATELVDMYREDYAARQSLLADMLAVESRPVGVTLLSAWLNSLAIQPHRRAEFNEIIRLELRE